MLIAIAAEFRRGVWVGPWELQPERGEESGKRKESKKRNLTYYYFFTHL